MVPHHPPKVPHGSRQRILGNDELTAVFVTLQEVNHSVTLKLALLYQCKRPYRHIRRVDVVRCLCLHHRQANAPSFSYDNDHSEEHQATVRLTPNYHQANTRLMLG